LTISFSKFLRNILKEGEEENGGDGEEEPN